MKYHPPVKPLWNSQTLFSYHRLLIEVMVCSWLHAKLSDSLCKHFKHLPIVCAWCKAKITLSWLRRSEQPKMFWIYVIESSLTWRNVNRYLEFLVCFFEIFAWCEAKISHFHDSQVVRASQKCSENVIESSLTWRNVNRCMEFVYTS